MAPIVPGILFVVFMATGAMGSAAKVTWAPTNICQTCHRLKVHWIAAETMSAFPATAGRHIVAFVIDYQAIGNSSIIRFISCPMSGHSLAIYGYLPIAASSGPALVQPAFP